MNGKRMKVIGIVSQKGGPGKTTIATNLSVEAERHGHTVALFDLDPQATAAKWGDHREVGTPAIMDIPASRLSHWLGIAEENGATLAIVDTAPNTNYEIPDIIKASSIVLIPCKPSKADVDAIKNTVTVAEQEKKPAYVILNMVRPNTNLGKEARKTIEDNYNAELACRLRSAIASVSFTPTTPAAASQNSNPTANPQTRYAGSTPISHRKWRCSICKRKISLTLSMNIKPKRKHHRKRRHPFQRLQNTPIYRHPVKAKRDSRLG